MVGARENICMICGEASWRYTKHKFPSDPELRKKWLSILKVDESEIKNRSRVCEKHFAKDQYVRTRIKSDAVPMSPSEDPSQRIERKIKRKSKSMPAAKDKDMHGIQPKTPTPTMQTIQLTLAKNPESINESQLWKDKVNLLGHCTFCLEALTNSNFTPQKLINSTWTSISDLWPYLLINPEAERETTINDFTFLQERNRKGELIFSKVPPMCNSCLPNLQTLHTLYQEMEEIKKKIMEQTKRVNDAALEIRKKLRKKSKLKRNQVQKALSSSNCPPTCFSNTNRFLNSLFGIDSFQPIAPNPVRITSKPITLLPATMSPAAISQNPRLLVINAASFSQVEMPPVITPAVDLPKPSTVEYTGTTTSRPKRHISKTKTNNRTIQVQEEAKIINAPGTVKMEINSFEEEADINHEVEEKEEELDKNLTNAGNIKVEVESLKEAGMEPNKVFSISASVNPLPNCRQQLKNRVSSCSPSRRAKRFKMASENEREPEDSDEEELIDVPVPSCSSKLDESEQDDCDSYAGESCDDPLA